MPARETGTGVSNLMIDVGNASTPFPVSLLPDCDWGWILHVDVESSVTVRTGPCTCCDGEVPMIGFRVLIEAPEFPMIDGLEVNIFAGTFGGGFCVWSSVFGDESDDWLLLEVFTGEVAGTVKIDLAWLDPDTETIFRTDVEIVPSFTCDPFFFDHTATVYEELGEVDVSTGHTVRVVVIEVMTELPSAGFTGEIEVEGELVVDATVTGEIEVEGEEIGDHSTVIVGEGEIEVEGEEIGDHSTVIVGEGEIEVEGEQGSNQTGEALTGGSIELAGEQAANQTGDGFTEGTIEVEGEQAGDNSPLFVGEGEIEVAGEQGSNQTGEAFTGGSIEVAGEQGSNQTGEAFTGGSIEVEGEETGA